MGGRQENEVVSDDIYLIHILRYPDMSVVSITCLQPLCNLFHLIQTYVPRLYFIP